MEEILIENLIRETGSTQLPARDQRVVNPSITQPTGGSDYDVLQSRFVRVRRLLSPRRGQQHLRKDGHKGASGLAYTEGVRVH